MASYEVLAALVDQVAVELRHDLRAAPRPEIVEAALKLFEGWVESSPGLEEARAAISRLFMRYGRRPPALDIQRSLERGYAFIRGPASLLPKGIGGRAVFDRALAPFQCSRLERLPEPEPKSSVEVAPLDVHAEAPSEAKPEEPFDVRVWTTPAEDPRRPELKAPLDAQGRTDVEVWLELPDGVRAEGPTRGWLLAQREEASPPISFQLIASVGRHTVEVFFQAGGLATKVSFSMLAQEAPEAITASITRRLDPGTERPIHTLYVIQRDELRRRFRFLFIPREGERLVVDHDLSCSVLEQLKGLVEALGDLYRMRSRQRRRVLLNQGERLATWALPKKIRKALAVAEGLLRIESEGPWLPWELLSVEGDDFLGAQLAIVRHPEKSEPLPSDLGGLLVPVDGGRAGDPKIGLEQLGGMEPTIDAVEDLIDRLYSEPIGALYFTGHGVLESSGRVGCVYIEGEEFRDTSLPQNRALCGALVVLNACFASAPAPSLSGHGPWVDALLGQAGAAAVVAPFIPIDVKLADALAERLFEGLAAGETLARALHHARQALGEEYPAVYAYTLHAHHAARWGRRGCG